MIDETAWFKIITGCIAAGMLFAGFVIILKQYMQKHYRPSLYLAIGWFGFFLEAAFATIRLLFDDVQVMLFFQKLSLIGLAPGFLGIMATRDSISRDYIEAKRISILVFILGINTILLIVSRDEKTIFIPNIIVIGIGIIISNTLLALYIRIYWQVPKHLKRYAFINIIGAFFIAVMYVIWRIVEIAFPNVLPPFARIFESLGAVLQASILSRYEQLFYVLPFKVQRLTVVGTKKGLSLFNFDWSGSEIIDQDLFSSILQGTSMILNESLQKGNFQEIKLEKGVILINHDATHPLASVLIASKSSLVLHEGLASFAKKFVKQYENVLDTLDTSNIKEDAGTLVKECFPFIPIFE
ncbi:MAG: hypothetical protein Q6373_000705 [Candidatus Sigynarchaeota archaeon]